jgi:UDP-N-acetylglucosamine--N-acetylmuramyl-(pentapeptide) pyrophosphoryl-undecaprenol N-acetylglucosamine transferase
MQVIHLTGVKDYESMMRSYHRLGPFEHRVHSFVDRMEEAYSASDLIVTRSGASALFEIAFFGRPMILVPYPFAASHQTENARVFSRKGAAIEIDERSLTPVLFKETLTGLLNNSSRLKKLSEEVRHFSAPEASEKLAREVLDLEKK